MVDCGKEKLLIVGDANVSGTCGERSFVVSCDGRIIGVPFGVSRYDCRIRFESGVCTECTEKDLGPASGGPAMPSSPFPVAIASTSIGRVPGYPPTLEAPGASPEPPGTRVVSDPRSAP